LLIQDTALKKTILQAMADDCALAILRSTTEKPCSAMEIIHQCALPPSSVYRRINELVDARLLTVERTVITNDGKKFGLYRNTVTDMRAEYKSGEVELTVSFNEDVVNKLTRLWSSMRAEK
jgi:predicted transcriptional regulator